MVSFFGTRVRRILFQGTEFNEGMPLLAHLGHVSHTKKQRRSKRTRDVPSTLLTSMEPSLSISLPEGILGALFTKHTQQETKPKSSSVMACPSLVSQGPPRKRQRKSFMMSSVVVSALMEPLQPSVEISKPSPVVSKLQNKQRAIAATNISSLVVVSQQVNMVDTEEQNMHIMKNTIAATVSRDDDGSLQQDLKINSIQAGSQVFDVEEIQPCIPAFPCRNFSPSRQGKRRKELGSYTNKVPAKCKAKSSTTTKIPESLGVGVKILQHSMPSGEESSSMETKINTKSYARTVKAEAPRVKPRRHSIPLTAQSRRSDRRPLPVDRYTPNNDHSNNCNNNDTKTSLVKEIEKDRFTMVVQSQHNAVVKTKSPTKIHPVTEKTTSKKRRRSMSSIDQSRRSGRQSIPIDRYIPEYVHQIPATRLVEEKVRGTVSSVVQQQYNSCVENPNCSSNDPVEKDVRLWSHEQVDALRDAQSMADPMSCSFWSFVAGHVEGKTEGDCRAKWFSLIQTPKAKVVKQQSKQELESLEDDLFHATPMRGGKVMNFEIDVGSPIVDTTIQERGELRVEANYCYDEIMELKQRVGYKTYLKGLRRAVTKAERDRRLNRTRKVKHSHVPRILSECINSDGIEMKCHLTPGGTIKIHKMTDEENDDDCYFNASDEE